jgi:hypothetical protein
MNPIIFAIAKNSNGEIVINSTDVPIHTTLDKVNFDPFDGFW